MATNTEGSRMLRLLTAAGLGVAAYVHIHLAGKYHVTGNSGLSQGLLFRVEGGVALLLALIVLASGSRFLHFLAFLVAASALGAVLLYSYTNVGRLGPLPDMHDPTWFTQKTVSAVADAVATLASAALVFRSRGGGGAAKTPKRRFRQSA
jgi:hypothetical protein